jgi:hypothetical protein
MFQTEVGGGMPLFQDLHEKRQFESVRDYEEFRLRLQQAIDRGFAEEVEPIKPNPLGEEYWFRDKESGEIFSLTPPDFPARGKWCQIDILDRFGSSEQTKPY